MAELDEFEKMNNYNRNFFIIITAIVIICLYINSLQTAMLFGKDSVVCTSTNDTCKIYHESNNQPKRVIYSFKRSDVLSYNIEEEYFTSRRRRSSIRNTIFRLNLHLKDGSYYKINGIPFVTKMGAKRTADKMLTKSNYKYNISYAKVAIFYFYNF